ncbi:MAG TPA: energy transducer TonB [Candidatus Acidoferrales bacterium]|nr:energy transducer TonB [Candidatus Acidoferrales bacterium]
MFDELVVSGGGRKGGRSKLSMLLSALLQFAILGLLVLFPLIYTEALPKGMLMTTLVAPPPPPPPAPPPPPVQKVVVKPVQRIIQQGKMMAPSVIPKDVKMIKEEELPPDVPVYSGAGGVPGGVPGGMPGGVMGGIIGGISGAPPPPKPEAPKRIRVSTGVQEAKILNQTRPIYPPLARQARIQGTVRLHAIISKEGTIQQLEVVSGPPLLVQAATEAVKQWRYKPTLLSDEPVEVETFIDVIFTLGG